MADPAELMAEMLELRASVARALAEYCANAAQLVRQQDENSAAIAKGLERSNALLDRLKRQAK